MTMVTRGQCVTRCACLPE